MITQAEYAVDPNRLALELCRRHEVELGPEATEAVSKKAFSDTIGKLPDLIEQKLISPVDGLYVMQVFMQYRTGNRKLSLVKGPRGVERLATAQEWGLIKLLFRGALSAVRNG